MGGILDKFIAKMIALGEPLPPRRSLDLRLSVDKNKTCLTFTLDETGRSLHSSHLKLLCKENINNKKQPIHSYRSINHPLSTMLLVLRQFDYACQDMI